MFKFLVLKFIALITIMISIVTPSSSPTPTPSAGPIAEEVGGITIPGFTASPTPTSRPATPTPTIEDFISQLEELKNEITAYTPEPTPTPQIIVVTPAPTIAPTQVPPTPTPVVLPQIYVEPQGFSGTSYFMYVYSNITIDRFPVFSASWDYSLNRYMPYGEVNNQIEVENIGQNKNTQKSAAFPYAHKLTINDAMSRAGTNVFIGAVDENGNSVVWKNAVLIQK